MKSIPTFTLAFAFAIAHKLYSNYVFKLSPYMVTAFAVFLLSLFVEIRRKAISGVGCRSPPANLNFFEKFRLEETKVFDNTNPYTIRFEETDGRKRYFVAFTDGQGNFRETEVTKAVYMEFCHFIKRERNLRRSDERHLEQSELTEETLCRRAIHKPKPVDEAVNDTIRMEQLNRAIMELPEIQRRRFMLHFDLGLTYEQIGEIEGCTKMPVKRSIDRAIEKILLALKNF